MFHFKNLICSLIACKLWVAIKTVYSMNDWHWCWCWGVVVRAVTLNFLSRCLSSFAMKGWKIANCVWQISCKKFASGLLWFCGNNSGCCWINCILSRCLVDTERTLLITKWCGRRSFSLNAQWLQMPLLPFWNRAIVVFLYERWIEFSTSVIYRVLIKLQFITCC